MLEFFNFDSTTIRQFRKKLHYHFRAGKTLQEDRETAEHTTCMPPGTLNLSKQMKTFLDMSHSPTLVIHKSPYKTPSELGSHTQACTTGIFQIIR